jgi:hypothetical protein
MFKEDYEALQAHHKQAKKNTQKRPSVKSAKQLTDYKGLRLKGYTRQYIMDKGYTVDQVVKMARDYAYHRSQGISYNRTWLEDLSTRLDMAGYIRHDFTDETFRVGQLYQTIYEVSGMDASNLYGSYHELTTNEAYETCPYVNAELYQKVINHIGSWLTDKEANAVKLRFGIGKSRSWTYTDIGRIYGIGGQAAHELVCDALRQLGKTKLPELS